ncbi:MAG: Gfo/Idh/MocA family oxidoreductase [Clostridia bacterium]|nr:Gfo/Idh/MocA family oxidoreductase [Clostridia bacterium]
MEKVRYGIIGLGNQGSYYTGLFAEGQIKDAEISAVCDINDAKIEKIKEKLEKLPDMPKIYKDYKEMVKSGLCDVILVETPHYFHPEMVEFCLQNGVSVICDKPAGVYTKQVREMNEVAKKSKATFGMMFNQRTNCTFRKMREIIASGGIGELQRVTWKITDWYRTQSYYDSGSWRATWKGEGGGVLINQCPHQLDLIQWVVGEMPVSVNAFCKYGRWHNIEVEDEVTAYLEYKNGATGVFITTTGETPGSNVFEVSGSLGKLICEDTSKLTWYKNKEDAFVHSRTSESGFLRPEYDIINVETDGKNEQHVGILNNFTQSMLGREKLFVSGEEGINGVELMNAMELSGWNGGEKICIPVDEDRYLKELDEKRAVSVYKDVNDDKVADTNNTFGTK